MNDPLPLFTAAIVSVLLVISAVTAALTGHFVLSVILFMALIIWRQILIQPSRFRRNYALAIQITRTETSHASSRAHPRWVRRRPSKRR